tara:strand:- start:2011 stop:3072 length:1062 start_codon:yes stop_codon:yes gene_type:complete
MPSPIQSILRAATRERGGKLNILTFPTHERYESNLCQTGHNFFSVAVPEYTKPGWDTDYAAIPENYTMLANINDIPLDMDFDLVLSQNKFGQFDIAAELSRRYNCPIVSLEHTCPPNENLTDELTQTVYSPEMREAMISQFYQKKAHVNVFISEWSRAEWGWKEDEGDVVHHGIDTSVFIPYAPMESRKNDCLSVVNDWANRDWCCGYTLWENIVHRTSTPTTVVGKNPGLSEPAENVEELAGKYNDSRIFLNTSIASPIPTTVLEAMSCGCAVVSTATGMIPEIIEDGYNGLLSNDPDKICENINMLRNDLELAETLSNNAIKTIQEKFSLNSFIDRWNSLFLHAEMLGERL